MADEIIMLKTVKSDQWKGLSTAEPLPGLLPILAKAIIIHLWTYYVSIRVDCNNLSGSR